MNPMMQVTLSNLDIGERGYPIAVEYEGGFRCVKYLGIPFFIDHRCQRNRIYLVDESTLKFFRVKPLSLWDRPGSTWRPVIHSGGTAYAAQIQANIVCFCNFGCFKPSSNTLIDDLEEFATTAVTGLP
jgi:hypothetical protein